MAKEIVQKKKLRKFDSTFLFDMLVDNSKRSWRLRRITSNLHTSDPTNPIFNSATGIRVTRLDTEKAILILSKGISFFCKENSQRVENCFGSFAKRHDEMYSIDG